ncbi:MAG: hypothetical protein Q8K32_10650 [Archangium sp.]|nr:hypothetical protein [Archangium sp.]
MNRFALVALLAACTAFAAKPRGSREEVVAPVATPLAPVDPAAVFAVDLGVGGWASSLVGATSLEVGVSLGRRLTRHLLLTGELSGGLSAFPATYQDGVLLRVSLAAHLAWDVLELVRSGGRVLPFEAGPEVGLGAAWMTPGGGLALPLVQLGAFARYVFSSALSLGLRLRGQLPFWASVPGAFTGNRFIAADFEPAGFTATASLVHTF